jgi:hypothetical protein
VRYEAPPFLASAIGKLMDFLLLQMSLPPELRP